VERVAGAEKARTRQKDDALARTSMLEDLARRHSAALSSYFRRRVKPASDVPDLVQDVFLRLSQLEDVTAVAKPDHYLFATASNALKDRARRAETRRVAAHVPFEESEHGGSDFAPDRVLAGKETLERVKKALLDLPERTRDIFVLRAFEEQRMAVIAQSLGISRRAAEKHYVRAMKHLTEVIGPWRDD
jgi:RNA polymerase sigma-70 factor (ECF subfamily)